MSSRSAWLWSNYLASQSYIASWITEKKRKKKKGKEKKKRKEKKRLLIATLTRVNLKNKAS